MKRVEIGNAVDAENDGLAIDYKMLLPVLQRGLDNPRIALGPVVAVAGDQAHAIAGALDPQPIAVILDFVEPIRRMWNLGSPCRNAKIERLKHAPEMVTSEPYCESRAVARYFAGRIICRVRAPQGEIVGS